jgi:hypothetical protein
MKTIGFALGCIWQFNDCGINRNNWIDWYRNNESYIGKINALEITLIPEWEDEFKLSSINYKWLENLDYISYHIVRITKNTETVINQLPFVNKFILHIDEKQVLTPDFIDKYQDGILLENVEDKDIPFEYEDNICFDIAHAMSIDNNYANAFYNKYHKQIKQIHLSRYNKELKHLPIYNSETKIDYINIMRYIKDLPIIIEENFNNIEEMRDEFNFINEVLN